MFARRTGRNPWALILPALILLPVLAWAQAFPPLTGRVVDRANLLKPEERASLEARLAALETRTTHQVAVATVPSLEGLAVEDYANRLFRFWQLGQKKTNNGVLLLVAPNDRKVRIEVGYGLEGTLTDALSKVIITTAIAPQFQRGDFAAGIDAGVNAILSILTGDAGAWQQQVQLREDDSTGWDPVIAFVLFVILYLFVVYFILGGSRRARRGRRGGWVAGTGDSGWSSGSSSSDSSSSSSSSFSGGGGSSGGGGASGSW